MKVSISLITYNHEKFIAQAIDSVLMQKVNFDYEIVIGEDHSTDNTRAIVIDYQKRYPDKIRLLLPKENLGFYGNKIFVQTLQVAQGQYIALLDGDDYWDCPYKLQTQVDFLDKHPEYSICFHNVNVIYEDKSINPHPFHMQEPRHRISTIVPKPTSALEDIVIGNFIQTCSAMFRSESVAAIPDWYYDLPLCDWMIYVMNAEHGNIGYIDEIMSVYRVHSGGIWSMKMSLLHKVDDIRNIIYMYEMIDRYLKFKYNREIASTVGQYYYKAARILYDTQRYTEAAQYAKKYLSSLPMRDRFRQTFMFVVMLRGYAPQTYNLLMLLKSLTVK